MTRKPISISATPETDSRYSTIFVLCDDGTVWRASRKVGWSEWEQIKVPPIPQPEPPEPRDGFDKFVGRYP